MQRQRVLAALAVLVLGIVGFSQSAQAQGGDRIRLWVENTSDGCANIYIYVNAPWGWPYLALNSGGGEEAPLEAYEVQPKIVCPLKNRGVRHVDYTMTARFSDGYVEPRRFYYDANGSFPTSGAIPPVVVNPQPGGVPPVVVNPQPGAIPPMQGGFFYANPPVIAPGQCSLLRWDIDGVRQIYFSGIGVTGHEGRCVYPSTTTTFYLRVIRYDGTEYYPAATVYVSTNPYPCPPYCNVQQTCPPYCGQTTSPVIVSGPIDAMGEKLMNLDGYCSAVYGGGARASFTSKTDAYTWGCYSGNSRIGGIDMNAVCRSQHPTHPRAVMTDRGNIYSWVCRP